MTERLNPALGIARVAIGRVDGLQQFGRTVQAFLGSLAPLLAFPIAGALFELFSAGWLSAVTTVVVSLILQLAPPVIAHALVVRWRREEAWLHYATAYNWCFWVLPLVAAALMVVFGTAVGAGLPVGLAANGVVIGFGLYSLWLNWFLARHGLGLPRGKAAVLVLLVNLGTLLLMVGPSLLADLSG